MLASFNRRLIIAEDAADVALNDIKESLKGGLERQEVGNPGNFLAVTFKHLLPLA